MPCEYNDIEIFLEELNPQKFFFVVNKFVVIWIRELAKLKLNPPQLIDDQIDQNKKTRHDVAWATFMLPAIK